MLFNLVLFPYLGCWDGNGNDVPAAVASSPVLHWALSSVLGVREVLHCLLVRGRAWEAEAPCHGAPSLDHWVEIGAPCLVCCWPHSYWGSSRTVGLKWLPLHPWYSEGGKKYSWLGLLSKIYGWFQQDFWRVCITSLGKDITMHILFWCTFTFKMKQLKLASQ